MSAIAVGLGLTSTAVESEVRRAIGAALAGVGRRCDEVTVVATTDRRRDHPVIVALADRGMAVLGFDPAVLAEVEVPNPSGPVAERAGTASVAEAASLLASGAATLLVTKQVGVGVTVALSEVEAPVVRPG